MELREPFGARPSVDASAGDILASEWSSRADVFTVSVVPAAGDENVARYSAVIERVKELARDHRVNGWFTIDLTH